VKKRRNEDVLTGNGGRKNLASVYAAGSSASVVTCSECGPGNYCPMNFSCLIVNKINTAWNMILSGILKSKR